MSDTDELILLHQALAGAGIVPRAIKDRSGAVIAIRLTAPRGGLELSAALGDRRGEHRA